MMKRIFIVFVLVSNLIFSQTQIDTSYTIASTYKKEKTKYPFIKVVEESTNKKICIINDIVYKSIDNRNLHFDSYFNKQNSIQPAVILIHGGGWKSGNKSQLHALAKEIASKGYACFCIEYRLSPEAKYPAGIIDIKTAIKFIKENASNYNVDINKIAVLGCSSGGQMAALIGTTNGNLLYEEDTNNQNSNVHAIIDMDGILAFHHPESEEGKVAALWLGGTYEEKPAVWEEASALSNCNENTPPILFINSSNPRFHAGQNDMIAILTKFGIYNEVYTLPNSPHSFWFFHPWFKEIVNYSTQFLDKILKNN
jgi:acetyl esterase/lipase